MGLNKPNNEIDISTLAHQNTLEEVQSTVDVMSTTLGNYGGVQTTSLLILHY